MMGHTEDIERLFSAVFEDHKKIFQVGMWDIKRAIVDMGRAYAPNPAWRTDEESITTSYDEAGPRCAYLFKYAMIHTGLVCEVLQNVLSIYSVRQNIDAKQPLHLCSLGSGPGTDIVALMFVLEHKFGTRRHHATLIDQSGEWRSVFDSIIFELRKEHYRISKMVSSNYFNYEYLEADLLYFDEDLEETISDADIITMIKFISAAACQDTRSMVERIFQLMKPGSMVLFIDNAAGGFYEMLQLCAEQCGLNPMFEPFKHYDYEEPLFKTEQYGFTSQFKTRVTYAMWKKPGTLEQNMTDQFPNEYFSGVQLSEKWNTNDLAVDFYDTNYPTLQSGIVNQRYISRIHPSENMSENNVRPGLFDDTDFPPLQSENVNQRNQVFSRIPPSENMKDNNGLAEGFDETDFPRLQSRNMNQSSELFSRIPRQENCWNNNGLANGFDETDYPTVQSGIVNQSKKFSSRIPPSENLGDNNGITGRSDETYYPTLESGIVNQCIGAVNQVQANRHPASVYAQPQSAINLTDSPEQSIKLQSDRPSVKEYKCCIIL